MINLIAVVAIIAALEYWASLHVKPPRRHIVDSFQFNHTWKPNGEKEHTFLSWRSKGEFSSYIHRYNSQGWLEYYDVVKDKPDGIYRIFQECFQDIPIPILAGFDIGHGKQNLTLPFGIEVTLDTDKQILAFDQPATVG